MPGAMRPTNGGDAVTPRDEGVEGMARGLVAVDGFDGVWTQTYSFGPGLANTFLADLGDGELLAMSPACHVTEAELDAVAEKGEVVALVAPNGFHHMGLRGWKDRFPGARLFASAVAAKRIHKKQKGLPTLEPTAALQEILPDHVQVFDLPHMKHTDTCARVDSEAGPAWFVNDALGNQAKLPKNPILGAAFKWTRSGPGYSVNRLALKFFGAEMGALGDWFASEVTAHPPRALVPGHGATLYGDDLPERTQAVVRAGMS